MFSLQWTCNKDSETRFEDCTSWREVICSLKCCLLITNRWLQSSAESVATHRCIWRKPCLSDCSCASLPICFGKFWIYLSRCQKICNTYSASCEEVSLKTNGQRISQNHSQWIRASGLEYKHPKNIVERNGRDGVSAEFKGKMSQGPCITNSRKIITSAYEHFVNLE